MMCHAALHTLARKSAMQWCIIILTTVFATIGVLQTSHAFAQNAAEPAQSTSGGQQLQTALSQASGARPVELKAEDRAILQQYGVFSQHAKYGEVWAPSSTPENWHPYMACHWVNTKQFGWYYDDKTPWGNIVHHYGRWTHDQQSGWIWIPGMEFSPGWVVWRTSAQWIGWAPIPPDQDVEVMQSDAFNNGSFWTFMETPHFNSSCKGGVAPQSQIPVLLKKTQYVTNFEFRGGIGVVVLPRYILGPYIDIFINVMPWPDLFYQHMMLVWTFIWNQLDVVNIEITIPCNNPTPPPEKPQPPPETRQPPPITHLPPTTGCSGIVNQDGICQENVPNEPVPLRPSTTQPPVQPPQQPPCTSPLYRDLNGNCVLPCPSGTRRQADGTCAPEASLPPPVLCIPPAVVNAYGRCVTACPPGTHPDYRSRRRHRGHGTHNVCVTDRNPLETCKPPLEADGRGGCREPRIPCYSPKQRNELGACLCPSGMQESASGSCYSVPTPVPLPCKSPLIPDSKGGCISPPVAPPSESVCPDGKPKEHGTCARDPDPCLSPRYRDYKGACIMPPAKIPPETIEPGREPCPEGRHREGKACVTDPYPPKSCTLPLIPNGRGGCIVPPALLPAPGPRTTPSLPSPDRPIICVKGTHFEDGRCMRDVTIPVLPPSVGPGSRTPGTSERPTQRDADVDYKQLRCPDGSFARSGRHCSHTWPARKHFPPSTAPKSTWPKPADYPKGPDSRSSGGGGAMKPMEPRQLRWPTQTPTQKYAPNYQYQKQKQSTPRYQSGGSVNGSENRGFNRLMRNRSSDGGGVMKPIEPRQLRWPTQTPTQKYAPNYQYQKQKQSTPRYQSGGSVNGSENRGFNRLMRNRSSEGGLFD